MAILCAIVTRSALPASMPRSGLLDAWGEILVIVDAVRAIRSRGKEALAATSLTATGDGALCGVAQDPVVDAGRRVIARGLEVRILGHTSQPSGPGARRLR